MRHALAVLVASSLIAGCARGAGAPAAPAPAASTNYVLGEVARASVGEPIFDVRVVKRVPTYVVARDHATPHLPITGLPPALPQGMVFHAVRGTPDGDLILFSDTYNPLVGIRIARDGVVTGGFVDHAGRTTVRGEWPPEPLFVPSSDEAEQSGAFRAKLLFLGSGGGVVRVFYQEYMHDRELPVFAQELRFDLSAGTTMVVRAVRIEVIRAEDTTIHFRVVEDGALAWLPGG